MSRSQAVGRPRRLHDHGAAGCSATGVVNQATWNLFSTGNSWTAGGGLSDGADRASAVSATAVIAPVVLNTYYAWTGAQLLADVQAFVSGSLPNYGWHLERTDATNDSLSRDVLRLGGHGHLPAVSRGGLHPAGARDVCHRRHGADVELAGERDECRGRVPGRRRRGRQCDGQPLDRRRRQGRELCPRHDHERRGELADD